MKNIPPYKSEYLCDECGVGHLESTGISYPTYPKQWPHECTNPDCDYKLSFTDMIYPTTIIEEI